MSRTGPTVVRRPLGRPARTGARVPEHHPLADLRAAVDQFDLAARCDPDALGEEAAAELFTAASALLDKVASGRLVVRRAR